MKSFCKTVAVGLFFLVTEIGCGGGTVDSATGSEGGPCYGNGTCNTGLVCSASGVCQRESVDPCEGVACSGHGTCQMVGSEATCVCEQGYHADGRACVESSDPCSGVTCSGHGTCVNNGETPQCNCEDGFHAQKLACLANVDPCSGMTCSGHGACKVIEEQAACDCESGYHAVSLECVLDVSPDRQLNFTRMMAFVTHWYGIDNESKLYSRLNLANVSKSDAVAFCLYSEYFEAARDPAGHGSWNLQASWKMLDKALSYCHERGIKLHVVYAPLNKSRGTLLKFGDEFAVVMGDGNKSDARLDIAFKELADYQLEILKFILQNYPSIDGVHFEEPQYYGLSYSPPILDCVEKKFAYRPAFGETKHGDRDVATDLRSCMMDATNDFFSRWKEVARQYKPNPDFLTSMNCATINNPSLIGIDTTYINDNHLFDFYVPQVGSGVLADVKYGAEKTKSKLPDTIIVPTAAITSSRILHDPPCSSSYSIPACVFQEFFKVIEWEHTWGAKATFIFETGRFGTPRSMWLDPGWPGATAGEIIGNVPRPSMPSP